MDSTSTLSTSLTSKYFFNFSHMPYNWIIIKKYSCSNRLCIAPLKFIMHTFSDCACVCQPNDKRCFELLEGKRQFTAEE